MHTGGNRDPHRPCVRRLVSALLLGFAALLPGAASAAECAEAAPLRFEVTGKIVRSELGFTQGLEFREGKLYESTGLVDGTTRINMISLSGQVTTLVELGSKVFGEGLTILGDEMIQLTWQDHAVFAYDLAGKLVRTMKNRRDGWGLTNDGTQLIFSDGEEAIYFADPKTFAITRTVALKAKRIARVVGLNELERVDDRLYGNIFTTWYIVRLDPQTGCIDGIADMRSLLDAMTPDERAHLAANPQYVLNGIAHDAAENKFFVTGKRWKSIFTGRFVAAQ